MLRSRGDWERETWRVAPWMEVPYLAPCAVVCAIFAYDPVPRYDEELKKLAAARSTTIGAMGAAELASAREVAWHAQFREITGDRVFLLADFGKAREGRDPGSPEAHVTSFLASSREPEGRKWLASKVLHARGRLYCWCIPFEAKRGHRTEVVLHGTNVTDFGPESAP